MTETTAEQITWHGDLADRLVDVSLIQTHPENPRIGDVDAIVDSIQVNGVYRPLYVQQSTGHILGGNHTFAALRRLGATHVPVQYVDVDDDRARRILAVDNKASDLGTYDNQALLDLLQSLDSDLTGTAYTEDDLADLIIDLEADPPDTDDIEAGPGAEKFNPDAQRTGVHRRIIVLDLSVDRYLWLVDALRQVCEKRNVESNAAAVLMMASDFTGTPVPRENEGLAEEGADAPESDEQ